MPGTGRRGRGQAVSQLGAATGALRLLWRGLGAQRAYLAGLERLTADHVGTLLALARGADTPAPAPAPAMAAAGDPAILLEGVAGATAAGGFLVENHLDHAISAPLRVSPFVSAEGHEVDVRLQLEPEVVTLEPREQLLVRVGTRIDAQLAGAGEYWGRLGVPELPGTELVVLVRVASGTPELIEDGAR
jgi:hypothetical protein